MTITGILDRVDDLKPNQLSQERKIEWLSELDAKFFGDIVQTHERDAASPEIFMPYSEAAGNTVLLIPDPYSEVYEYYLYMKMDLANGELTKYQNSKALYEAAWNAYARKYHREHMPLQRALTWNF